MKCCEPIHGGVESISIEVALPRKLPTSNNNRFQYILIHNKHSPKYTNGRSSSSNNGDSGGNN